MICKVISPQHKQEYQDLLSVTLPASDGEVEILPGHALSYFILRSGTATLKNKQTIDISIIDGVGVIKNDEILIIQ